MERGIYNGGIPRYQDDMEVTVRGDDEWRCSWCRSQDDGDSSPSSRNTLGDGKTANSKSQTSNVKMVVAESGGGVALGNAEVEWWAIHVSELKLQSLSSWNTLGDTSHNSNKLKQNWVKLGWWKCMVGKPMRKWWRWLMKKQPALSSRNTLGDSNHY